MKRDFDSMTVDELWALRSEVSSSLVKRITAEKTKLERRLRQLKTDSAPAENVRRERRPYPQVFPRYYNPVNPTETWAGRGKQPRWLFAQLMAGKKLDDFRIQPLSSAGRSSGGRKANPAQG
jgi:DNA-binding protein H-NS